METKNPFVQMPEVYRADYEKMKETIEILTKENNELKTKTAQNKKDPEEREYILLMSYMDGDSEFKIITGRTDAYEYIRSNLDNSPILDESYVLVEGRVPELRITAYDFCKLVQSVYSDGFDIDEYMNYDPEAVKADDSSKELFNNRTFGKGPIINHDSDDINGEEDV